MKVCHRCHAPWSEPGQPGFNNTCGQCGIPLHSCGNCSFFVRSGQIRCTIPQAERVLDWQSGNRCRHFEFQEISVAIAQGRPAATNGNGRSGKDRWNDIFSKA
jgi:hypothetical protein